MKTLMLIAAVGAVSALGGCQSAVDPSASHANAVDACASIEDEEARTRCIRNVVADVAASTKREQERRGGR